MCVIFACEDNFPSKKNLKDAEMMNTDGAGVAWLDNDKRIHFKKGIDGLSVWKMIKSKELKLPCIIHFRIASSGSVTKGLTHPFIISKTSPIILSGILPKGHNGVLFHNGTINDYEEMLKKNIMLSQSKMLKGQISDSRVMSFICALYGHEFINVLSEGWNKYAILDSKGIHKYGEWGKVNKTKGLTHSNNYYEDDFYGNMYSNQQEDFKVIDGLTPYGIHGGYQGNYYRYGGSNRGFEDDLYKDESHSITAYIPKEEDKEIENDIALSKMFNEECEKRENAKHIKKPTKKEVRQMNISFLNSDGWKVEQLECKSNKMLDRMVEHTQLLQAEKLKNQILMKENQLQKVRDKLVTNVDKTVKYTIEQHENDYEKLIVKHENKTAFSEVIDNI